MDWTRSVLLVGVVVVFPSTAVSAERGRYEVPIARGGRERSKVSEAVSRTEEHGWEL